MIRDEIRYCKKDGQRLVLVDNGSTVSWECPKIRNRWLPGITTDWFKHTSVVVGRSEGLFDERTGERR